jgi:hypothetical protein
MFQGCKKIEYPQNLMLHLDWFCAAVMHRPVSSAFASYQAEKDIMNLPGMWNENFVRADVNAMIRNREIT